MKLNYKPQIDGLRGIAVIAVVFYHAKFKILEHNFLSGGFLGVDIFFLISGYLISRQIFLEIKKKNFFSFKEFYIRRAKRILPVLIFVSLFFLIISFYFLLPGELVLFSKSIIYQLFFLSNFNFWHYYHFGYMTEDALKLPFLHTWSLSLEEQFYIFFPISILIFFKFFKKKLLVILVLFLVLFFLLSNFATFNFKSFSFYMLPFRVWEFLPGVILAYMEIFKLKIFKQKFFGFNLLIGSSFVILFIYLFTFDSKFEHPSFYTFFLILSVFLIIYFINEDNFFNRMLSHKFIVNIGLISYSLYLWHYPIFSFFRHIYGNSFENLILLKFFIILISLFFSYISYILIEKKFRHPSIKIKNVLIFILSLTCLIFLFVFSIFNTNGFVNRLALSSFQQDELNIKKIDIDFETNKIKKNKKNFIVVGNSHGKDFYMNIKNNASINKNINLYYFEAQIHCLVDILKLGQNVCERFFQRNQDQVIKNIENFNNADTIILKTRWYKESINELENTIKYLIKFNKKIIIVSSLPEFSNYYKIEISKKYVNTILKKIFYNSQLPLQKFILENDRFPNRIEIKKIQNKYYELLDKKIVSNNQILKNIADKYDLTFLDDFKFICDLKIKSCLASDDEENIIHLDTKGHLTNNGGKFISKKMQEENWF